MLTKAQLKHGAYYKGRCERTSATVGRWNANTGKFICMRSKFGYTSPIEIDHAEDDDGHHDIFIPEREMEAPEQEIPLE